MSDFSDSEDDFKPGASKAKGQKRKKTQKKKPCAKKAKEDLIDPNRCRHCLQLHEDCLPHEVQPNEALEECEALFSEKIQNSLIVDEYAEDERLDLRITEVS